MSLSELPDSCCSRLFYLCLNTADQTLQLLTWLDFAAAMFSIITDGASEPTDATQLFLIHIFYFANMMDFPNYIHLHWRLNFKLQNTNFKTIITNDNSRRCSSLMKHFSV